MADQVRVNYIQKNVLAPAASAWEAEIENGPFSHDKRRVTASSFANILTTLGTTYTTIAAEVNT